MHGKFYQQLQNFVNNIQAQTSKHDMISYFRLKYATLLPVPMQFNMIFIIHLFFAFFYILIIFKFNLEYVYLMLIARKTSNLVTGLQPFQAINKIKKIFIGHNLTS